MKGPGRARPTIGLVKEAVFQLLEVRLGDALPEWAFFDVCGGTGQMAFEALSVGFAPVHAGEVEPERIAHLIAETRRLELPLQIHKRDFRRMAPLVRREARSVVFVDPPYSFWKRDGSCPAMDRLLHNLLRGEGAGRAEDEDAEEAASAAGETLLIIHGPEYYRPPEEQGAAGRIVGREEREYRRQRLVLLHVELHPPADSSP